MGDVNELAASILADSIPQSFLDYIEEHRKEILKELRQTGTCCVPNPYGSGFIVLKVKK